MKTTLVIALLPAIALAEPRRSINVGPFGALAGDYAITYEELFAGRYGLVVEGNATRLAGDGGSALELGGAVGYRWHWRHRQNSGFLGVMLANRAGTGEAIRHAGGDEMTYAMRLRATSLTLNVGKRWMIGRHANITLRAGAGWGRYAVHAVDDTSDAHDAEQDVRAYLRFMPLAFDGELSAGVAF